MRRSALAALALVAVLAAAGARADEPDPDLVLAEAKPYRDALELCAARAAKALAGGTLPPERAARTALARCRSREARLRTFLIDQLGEASADRILEALRTTYLDSLVDVVRELRSR
jgi:hypothetical protein